MSKDRLKIYTSTPIWVYLLGLFLGGVGFSFAYFVFGSLTRGDQEKKEITISDAELQEIIDSRDTSYGDVEPYSLHIPVSDAERDAARALIENPNASVDAPTWFPKGESPLLTALVESGDLPPVAERVGPEPVVLDAAEGIGTYGGIWTRIATRPGDVGVVSSRMAGATVTRFSPLGEPVVPHLMRDIEVLNNSKTFVFHFRKGVKWSDGHPLDAGDLMFWWEQEVNNKKINGTPPSWLRQENDVAEFTKVDDYTVRIDFKKPYPTFTQVLALESRSMFSPEHYTSTYHPDFADEAVIDDYKAKFGVGSARQMYRQMAHFLNPQYPRLWPWVSAEYRNLAPYRFVRNPYYYVVDKEGNQLPYIDQLQFNVLNRRMLTLSVTNNKVSMQQRHLTFSDYTEMMVPRKDKGYEVYLWATEDRGDFSIFPNSNRRVDPEDPTTEQRAILLGNKDFRKALSLGINRDLIVRAYYKGVTTPSQVEPGPGSPFHSPELANAYIDYDPDLANAMLDELWRELGGNPEERDEEGLRLFPDGSRMVFNLDASQFTGLGPLQFVVDDWRKLGIRIRLRERQRTIFMLDRNARNFDFMVWGTGGRYPSMANPNVATARGDLFAPGWGTWFDKGGLFGSEEAETNASVPVPEGHPMYEAMKLQVQLAQTPSLEEQVAIHDRIAEIARENLWFINLNTAPPMPVVLSKEMRNVPKKAVYGWPSLSPANTGIETYYFENYSVSDGALRQMDEALRNPPPMPMLAAGMVEEGGGKAFGKLLRGAFTLLFIIVVIMMIIRHPYIGRRLILMIPTLIIISMAVFTIIQLPPGDFLTSKIIQLEEAGDDPEVVMQDIENLRDKFHFDDPGWKRYLRWVGMYWFTSFDDADKGLLQGDMGISMETEKEVNDMVGDRMLLTFFISLGTILFTWAVALPIGIFSAVKQHSIADYAITIVGFLGMCIPAFLLALILMATAGVSGLFSPEFETQPEWDLPKILDLLSHIWVPIVVLGVGGTASMIRVMRANLLDELKKPYVTTARAKGKRPISLLFKYPVRIALNPFISGIGGLFPQLVSGGAIVAMVLTLPTVGPLMLSALMSEDMNLAGSMLMLLSLLGVIGTLVSDMLLLLIDPRIRLEGGSK